MLEKRTILKGGMVISSASVKKADILLQGEKIGKIAPQIELEDGDICVDAEGKYIFPGFIDAHTHFDLHVAGTVTADDFDSGTKAALLGGTTTIIDFATQYKGESLQTAVANWHKKADGKSHCDYGFHLAISDWNDEVRDEIEAIVKEGIPTFKLYMTYADMMLPKDQMSAIIARLKECNAITGVHCEEDAIIQKYTKEVLEKAENRKSVFSHYKARPDIAEAEAVKNLLKMAEEIEAQVIVVHLSSKAGYEEIKKARGRGQKVIVETCPQYLLLDNSAYDQSGFAGASFIIAPPLRKKEDAECLWNAIKTGEIDTIATDHCSFTLLQKERGKEDFQKIPGGMPGVETRAVLFYEFGVVQRHISLSKMCELLSENSAKIYGLYPQKGVLLEGSDADLVIFNPNSPNVIKAATQSSKAGYSPFEDTKVSGSIERVYLRGEEVIAEGEVLKKFRGRYQKRETNR